MDIYDLFSKFQLELCPDSWAQEIWNDDFSTLGEFPPEFEEHLENCDIGELMSVTCKFIRDWLSSGNSDSFVSRPSTSDDVQNSSRIDSKSWQDLKSNGVQYKALTSMLSIFILRGKEANSIEAQRIGLIATDLYLTLLAIPGSEVFKIFNSILYSNAMENLKVCSSVINVTTKPKPTKKKKRGRAEEELDDEDNFSEGEELTSSDRSAILKLLTNIVNNMLFVLKKFNFKDKEDSLIITIQILILLTRVERESSLNVSRPPSSVSKGSLASKAYQILSNLCNTNNGNTNETVLLIMKEMMPGFLTFSPDGLKYAPNEVNVIKDHSLYFVRVLLSKLKKSAYTGVLTLVQHVMFRIPDKADLRAKGVQVVSELLDVLPYPLYKQVVVWILTFCFNDQVKYRVSGLEVVTKLLYMDKKSPTSPREDSPDDSLGNTSNTHENADDSVSNAQKNMDLSTQGDYSAHKFLLASVFSRCQDSTSSVRAKALAMLANLFSSNNKNIKHELESIFVTPFLNEVNSGERQEKSEEKGFFNLLNLLKNRHNTNSADVDPLPGAKAVIKMIEIFIMDEKVFVRKSALQVLTNIFLLNEKWMSNKLLQVMVDNGRDTAVLVRKLLVQCLTDLVLHYPSHTQLPKYWVDGVMPLLSDQEVKSQEKVLEVLQSVVLDNIVAYNQMKTPLHSLSWKIIELIVYKHQKLFSFACHKWTLNNSIKQSLITSIKTHIGTEHNSSAWYLFASLAEYTDIKDPMFVWDYFCDNVLNSQMVDEYCCQLVVEVMHLSWRQLPLSARVQLCDNVLRNLSNFTVPLPIISRCIDICHLITESQADTPEEGRENVKQWAGNLIAVCEHRLEKVIGPDSPLCIEDEVRLCQYIFTLGDASLISPVAVKKQTITLIQNLLLNIDNYIPDEENKEELWKGTASCVVQGFAVATLGKLCLQKADTAKQLVPLLGYLLSTTPHAEIKINAMIALTDMCIKFTSMVERQLPEMCMCLKDKRLSVRQNTLRLLIQLIQEDYLKIRCPMFFHILTMLLDEERVIRDTTSAFIINSVLVKQKNALIQHFVEGLFHYNAYLDHSTYAKVGQMTGRERALFSLEGVGKQDQRRSIYRFMLENMDDEHRFKVTYRCCVDVLAGVAEGKIKLTSSGTTLLQDALYVLSCDEIRLAQLRPTNKDDEDNDMAEEAQVNQAINQLARKTLVTQVVRKNMIENIVPIIIKLKHTLKKLKSPLVRDLMACLRELMKDYKTEIDEILSADKELAAEVAHDLKALEEEENEEEKKSEVSTDSVATVLKKVFEYEARKSLNTSTRRSSRLSTSSVGVSPKAQNKAGSLSPTTSTLSPPSQHPSPGSPKSPLSDNDNRTTPPTSRKKKNRTSPLSEKQPSPSTSIVLEPIPSTSGENKKRSSSFSAEKPLASPSSCSTLSDASQGSAGEQRTSMRSRKNRASCSSNNSEASSSSQNKTKAGRARRKK